VDRGAALRSRLPPRPGTRVARLVVRVFHLVAIGVRLLFVASCLLGRSKPRHLCLDHLVGAGPTDLSTSVVAAVA
jgi:hypothetical protein